MGKDATPEAGEASPEVQYELWRVSLCALDVNSRASRESSLQETLTDAIEHKFQLKTHTHTHVSCAVERLVRRTSSSQDAGDACLELPPTVFFCVEHQRDTPPSLRRYARHVQ